MKLNQLDWIRRDPGSLIATFGQARLVKNTGNNRFELIGGTPADHAQAREWVSLFCHEAVLPGRPRQPRPGDFVPGEGRER